MADKSFLPCSYLIVTADAFKQLISKEMHFNSEGDVGFRLNSLLSSNYDPVDDLSAYRNNASSTLFDTSKQHENCKKPFSS